MTLDTSAVLSVGQKVVFFTTGRNGRSPEDYHGKIIAVIPASPGKGRGLRYTVETRGAAARVFTIRPAHIVRVA